MEQKVDLDIIYWKKLQAKDEQAFTYIYDKYWTLLFLQAIKLLENETIAKDVVQDVFLKIWDNATQINIETNLGGYLSKMLRNRILNHFVQNKISDKHLEIFGNILNDYINDSDARLRTHFGQQIIEENIQGLPEKMKEIFLLHREQNLSYKQISELKHISENTVKKQISNALKILRKKLEILTQSFF